MPGDPLLELRWGSALRPVRGLTRPKWSPAPRRRAEVGFTSACGFDGRAARGYCKARRAISRAQLPAAQRARRGGVGGRYLRGNGR
jgi:hypothetical protein